MPFYGLYIPVKVVLANSNSANVTTNDNHNVDESQYVFQKKSEALEVLKKNKDARLKEFNSEDEAIKYAQTGFEMVQTKYNDIKTPTSAAEKANFRGPTKQELIEFRKIIESGDCERVNSMIWDNPRYLVSSGDTPTTLKEGYRYNALHICAISKKALVADLILKTVSDPKFIDLLTGKKDERICSELSANLLDYYLNIPEKGRSETPLHLAAKNGCVEMVEVLISYPECKMQKNKDNLLPKQIICARVANPNVDVIRKIEALLDERFYVPVLRCSDNVMPAQIGQPFSFNDPPNLNSDPLSPEVEIKALAGPMSKDQANKFFRRWKTPPRIGSNVSSPVANSHFISPMRSQSLSYVSVNGTPIKANLSSSPVSSRKSAAKRPILFNSTPKRNEDMDYFRSNGCHKSLSFDDSYNLQKNSKNNLHNVCCVKETNNNHNNLNGSNDVTDSTDRTTFKLPLCPPTPVLRSRKNAFFQYRDPIVPSPMLGTIDTVSENDSYFEVSSIVDTPGFKERHIKNIDTEKGLECIGRELAKEQHVEWREYWDFLDEFTDIAASNGLQKLENYLAAQQQKDIINNKNTANVYTNHQEIAMLNNVCNALEKFGFASNRQNTYRHNNHQPNGIKHTEVPENDLKDFGSSSIHITSHQSSTPYIYVEKSLQVHAKRMTKTIVHKIDNVTSINDSLLSDLKRVKSLICSFKEDVSFLDVNFDKVHSRIGNLVSIFLMNSQEVTGHLKAKILSTLQSLLCIQGERREHLECVCSRIHYMLQHPVSQILPENLKTEEVCLKIWLQEQNCNCKWDSNLSRKTSRRSRIEARMNQRGLRLRKDDQLEREHNESNDDMFRKTNREDWRNPISSNESSDDTDDEVFWSDIGYSKDDDDVWFTPPESPSNCDLQFDLEDDAYKVFIYGNEPTKRDLDVLNAIFHVELDAMKYPNICAWKSALMRFSNEEMDYFPSPRIITCSQSQNSNSSISMMMNSTSASMQRAYALARCQTMPIGIVGKRSLTQLPKAKSAFQLPPRSKSMIMTTRNSLSANTTAVDAIDTVTTTTTTSRVTSDDARESTPCATAASPVFNRSNAFLKYREHMNSFDSSSSSSGMLGGDDNSMQGVNNKLSLLNISTFE